MSFLKRVVWWLFFAFLMVMSYLIVLGDMLSNHKWIEVAFAGSIIVALFYLWAAVYELFFD